MSCQRPFRLRRLSVRRPPDDRMRLRKPCVRARLRLDLFLRCFFIALRHYTDGWNRNQGEIA